MNPRNLWSGLAALLVALALMAGCSKDNSTAPGMGTARMFVTDAPAAIDAVNLVITGVAVRHSGADTVTGWQTLSSDSMTFDLLTLRGGVLAPLASGVIPSGAYDEVRLKLGAGSTVTVDGVVHPLVVPSGSTSGLKIKGPFTVPDGGTIDVAIDFDAARSIFQTGSGTWMMRPVIRIVAVSTTGSIVGTLSPANVGAFIWALAGVDTVQGTTPDAATGHFTLAGLPAGTYAVLIDADTTHADTTITGVGVAAGGTNDLGTIPLSPR